MKKLFIRLCCAVIIIITALNCFVPAAALIDVNTRTVRVGFYKIDGFNVMDDDGKKSGYGYEVLQAMKLYNNWRYEYIGYDKGWADIQKMIRDGEIDMVISAVRTPEREEQYDFSKLSVAQSGSCLMVKAGQSPYVAGDYKNYNGMRIGFIDSASQIEKAEEFAAEKGFTYTPVYYKTSNELEDAIQNSDDIDAIVTSNMRIVPGTRRLEIFAMQDVCAMVKKGNAELLSEIDFALEQINLYNPGLYNALYGKYYLVDTGDDIFFSPDETEFIKQFKASGEKLKITMRTDIFPYSFMEDGVPSGILYDISMKILDRAGLEYETAVDEAAGGEGADLLLTTMFDYSYAENTGYTLIDPYYNTTISKITKKSNNAAAENIAVVKGSLMETHYLPMILNGENVFTFATAYDCKDAVLSGKCDAFYTLTRTANELVLSDETNRLASVVMPRFTIDFSIGVRDNTDARLASILEKSAQSLSDADKAEIVMKYTENSVRPLTLVGMFYSNPFLMISLITVILALLFTTVIMILIVRRHRLKHAQNLQLQNALDSAEQANLAKSVFMSRMSHEIRTPLNAIIGYNSISRTALSEAKNDADYKHAAMKTVTCLEKCEIASKHLLTVINDVLDMAAIESGRISIYNEPFDFKNMLTALTMMFFSQAKAKGISFDVQFGTPTEEWFVGDQMRLNQIMTNLISNAVKFTQSGGHVRILISQIDESNEKTKLRFSIADNGIGMSKDYVANIWAPFEQADSSISRRFGGTGLGLSITKNLVDLMNGSIRVTSKLGEGTTFDVELPFERTPQSSQDFARDFSNIHILIADEDASTCDYLKLLFEKFGVKCTTVVSSDDAAAAVAEKAKSGNGFYACIIDWYMKNGGADTIKKIRAAAGNNAPIILISAYDFSDIESSDSDMDIKSFVPKPIFKSTVSDLLANHFGGVHTAEGIMTSKPDFKGARVLLAEDNQMNMEVAKVILSSWNIKVDEAYNGTQAVDMFCASRVGEYKAILMDVHMPEMDGYRATKTIRASIHPDGAAIPIIAMTASVFAEDVAAALAAGMNAHVGKPIDKKALLGTLRKFIQ